MAARKPVVEVVEARNPLPKDMTGTSSPYARADFDGHRRKTRTVVRDLNPALEFSFPPAVAGVDTLAAWDLPPNATVPVSGLDGKGCAADAYDVAKYGPKWARTRTVADRFDPAWNEQYAWPVYDPCSVLSIDVFDDPPSPDAGGGTTTTKDAVSSLHDVGLGQGEPRASVRSASASNLRFGRGHAPFISSSGSSSSIYHSAEGSPGPSVGSSTPPSYSQGHGGSPPVGPSGFPPPHQPHSGSPPPPPPPPRVNDAERSSALDMGLIAYGATATVGVFAEIKELMGRWGTAPKVAFGVTTAMAISSLGFGLMTAVPRPVPFSRRRRFSAFCARLSTVLSTALLIISTSCVIVPNGWMVGVPVAAVVATVMIALCVLEELSAEEGVSNFWARQKPAQEADTELDSIPIQ
ncbi:hypothetical protein EJB05_15217, partial [Eragrostis curvula]